MITRNQYIEYLLSTPINYTLFKFIGAFGECQSRHGDRFSAKPEVHAKRFVGFG